MRDMHLCPGAAATPSDITASVLPILVPLCEPPSEDRVSGCARHWTKAGAGTHTEAWQPGEGVAEPGLLQVQHSRALPLPGGTSAVQRCCLHVCRDLARRSLAIGARVVVLPLRLKSPAVEIHEHFHMAQVLHVHSQCCIACTKLLGLQSCISTPRLQQHKGTQLFRV